MTRAPVTCHACGAQIRQREKQVRCWGLRWHFACWPAAGVPVPPPDAPSTRGRGRPPRTGAPTTTRSIRLTDDEAKRYDARAAAAGRTWGEHVRALLERDAATAAARRRA